MKMENEKMKSNIEKSKRCWKTHKYVFLHAICALSFAASASSQLQPSQMSLSYRIRFEFSFSLSWNWHWPWTGSGMGKDEMDWDKAMKKESKKRTEKGKKLTNSMLAALFVSDLLSPRVFPLLLHSTFPVLTWTILLHFSFVLLHTPCTYSLELKWQNYIFESLSFG